MSHAHYVSISRQDACTDTATCVHWNYLFHNECKKNSLSYKEKDNFPEESSFEILSSSYALAVTRVMNVLSMLIGALMMQLSRKCHVTEMRNWNSRIFFVSPINHKKL